MRTRLLRFASAITAAIALAACFLDLDHLAGECTGAACDAGRSEDEAGTDAASGDAPASGDAAGNDCPSLHGPKPVRVVARGGSFCIDSTEVTAGQYAEFLAARGSDTSGQAPACASNTTFAPLVAPSSLPAASAIGGVDWCDAAAFCAWSGKTLCGGFDGGPIAMSDANNPMKSVWFAACSADGNRAYPYGDAIQKSACNAFNRTNAPVAVATSPSCEGGYPGLFDLVGNVQEWTASCEQGADPANDGCLLRGGHYTSTADEEVGCTTPAPRYAEPRSSAASWRGIRCCSR